MTREQYGFAVGFAIAVVWAGAGFLVVIAAVVAGLVGFAVTRVVVGSPEAGDLLDRLAGRRRY